MSETPEFIAATIPASICLLRLSAIGDSCHVLPLLHCLRQAWPNAQITWIIGRTEARLMSLLPEVEFIIVDKRGGLAELRRLRRVLASRRFDLLLHLQLALRASIVSSLVRARVRLGFNRARARELQWLFTNASIAARERQHVQDSFMEFAIALGLAPPAPPVWPLVPSQATRERASALIADGVRVLLINPCSSHELRNWHAAGYAAVADHAHRQHGMTVMLVGGSSSAERAMAERIAAAATTPVQNRIGADDLPQLLALLERATVLLSPDSGPVHMATITATPVIGLYAATNPARSGPYRSRQWCIDRYGEAARRFRGKHADALPWHCKIEEPGVMDLITVADVTTQLDKLLGSRQ
ncbi:MAG: glycosyltransferase family 9 protein [Steroidobacteraceae bacterium]